jgi:hypothetical protein
MRNIFLLPTEKPSRLGYLTKKGKEVFKDLRLFDIPMPNILDSENQHIYITSTEEPKEGDWGFDGFHIFKCLKPFIANETTSGKNIPCFYIDYDGMSNVFHETSYIKKIVLTTDQDLIKDGVQGISDEFLQWFITNPSCEYVELVSELKCFDKNDLCVSVCVFDTDYTKMVYYLYTPKHEPKQETLEESAKSIYPDNGYKDELYCDMGEYNRELFIKGAEWQAERIINFLNEEITERRDYSASKMCEVIRDFIKQ